MNNSTSTNPTLLLEQGKTLLGLAYYETALAKFKQVLELQSDNHNIWVLHAATLTHFDNYSEALKSLDMALKFCPPNVEKDSEYDRETIALFRGIVLHELGQDRETNSSFASALTIETLKESSFWQKFWQKLTTDFKKLHRRADKSEQRAIPSLIGERLQVAGLISEERIESILAYQRKHPHLRFGDIAVMWGWLKPETFDFFVKQLPHSHQAQPSQRLGYYLKSAALLNDIQIGIILEYQREKQGLRFGEIAVRQGWLRPETLDFFLGHFCH